jgi:hypothetical protein
MAPMPNLIYFLCLLRSAFHVIDQGCQIFLGTWYQNQKKMYQMNTKVPNEHKKYQMVIDYPKCP